MPILALYNIQTLHNSTKSVIILVKPITAVKTSFKKTWDVDVSWKCSSLGTTFITRTEIVDWVRRCDSNTCMIWENKEPLPWQRESTKQTIWQTVSTKVTAVSRRPWSTATKKALSLQTEFMTQRLYENRIQKAPKSHWLDLLTNLQWRWMTFVSLFM